MNIINAIISTFPSFRDFHFSGGDLRNPGSLLAYSAVEVTRLACSARYSQLLNE